MSQASSHKEITFMQTKPLLIAVAAFAVTATGVYAQGPVTKILERANLTEEQRSALEVAHELREEGNLDGARDVLMEAGFDEDTLLSIHRAGHEVHEEIKAAIEAEDYDAFLVAVEGTPMADEIDTEDKFMQLVEAHQLREEGDFEAARTIMDELGLKPRGHMKGHYRDSRGFSELSDEQREALKVARQSNDKEAVEAILEEAGIAMPSHHGKGQTN